MFGLCISFSHVVCGCFIKQTYVFQQTMECNIYHMLTGTAFNIYRHPTFISIIAININIKNIFNYTENNI